MPDELLFTVRGSTAIPAEPLSLAQAGLQERRDLQEWVIAHPEILGPDIKIVTMEFDRWQAAGGRPADRLDILGLHTSGELVVAELKRDRAPDTVEMQAIKYAAMVSRFTPDTLAEQHAKFLSDRGTAIDADSAADLLARHAEITPETLRRPRIVLLASEYPATTAATAVWLSEMGINITLMQYRAYRTGAEISISVSQLYPVPAVEEFTISPRQAEVRAVEQVRKRREDIGTVAKIISGHLLEDGAALTLRPYGINADIREKLDAWLAEDPTRRQATWRNDEDHPIVWSADGKAYTPTTVSRLMLREACGLDRAVRGGDWWTDADGHSLVDMAKGVGAWDEAAFRKALDDWVAEPLRERILRVLDHALQSPHVTTPVYWGDGKYPSANLGFRFPNPVNGYGAVVWSIYTDPERTVFAFNFDWMRWGGVSDDAMKLMADEMRKLPGVAPLYADLEASGYKKRPSIPVNVLFADEQTPDVITRCADRLLDSLWQAASPNGHH